MNVDVGSAELCAECVAKVDVGRVGIDQLDLLQVDLIVEWLGGGVVVLRFENVEVATPFFIGEEGDPAVFEDTAVDDDLFLFEELASICREDEFFHAGEGVGGTAFHGAEDRHFFKFQSDVGEGLYDGEAGSIQLKVEGDEFGHVFFRQAGQLLRRGDGREGDDGRDEDETHEAGQADADDFQGLFHGLETLS